MQAFAQSLCSGTAPHRWWRWELWSASLRSRSNKTVSAETCFYVLLHSVTINKMENHCRSSLAFSPYQSFSFLLRQYKTSKRENKFNYSLVHGKKTPFSPEFPLELPGCNGEKNLLIPLLRRARALSGCYPSWPSTVHGKAQPSPAPPRTAPFARGAGSHGYRGGNSPGRLQHTKRFPMPARGEHRSLPAQHSWLLHRPMQSHPPGHNPAVCLCRELRAACGFNAYPQAIELNLPTVRKNRSHQLLNHSRPHTTTPTGPKHHVGFRLTLSMFLLWP